jgi:signal peptidase I
MQIDPDQQTISSREITTFNPRTTADAQPRAPINLTTIRRATRKFWENVLAIGLLVFGFNALFVVTPVNDYAMSPSFLPGETLLGSSATYWILTPRRGEIVVVVDTEDNTKFIRRIIGVPGDKIELIGGQVWINDQVLNEPYAIADFNSARSEFRLGKNDYFILADNRNLATRMVGSFPANRILARSWLILWPLDKLGRVKIVS